MVSTLHAMQKQNKTFNNTTHYISTVKPLQMDTPAHQLCGQWNTPVHTLRANLTQHSIICKHIQQFCSKMFCYVAYSTSYGQLCFNECLKLFGSTLLISIAQQRDLPLFYSIYSAHTYAGHAHEAATCATCTSYIYALNSKLASSCKALKYVICITIIFQHFSLGL